MNMRNTMVQLGWYRSVPHLGIFGAGLHVNEGQKRHESQPPEKRPELHSAGPTFYPQHG
jgi:hypothetical protein